jgi:hypothetical protein
MIRKQILMGATSLIACLATVCLLYCLALGYSFYEEDVRYWQDAGSQMYSIDPEDVPTAIDTADFLKPMPTVGGPIPTRESAMPRMVTPDDFYRIARRASQEWGNLPFTSMGFGAPCEYAEYGPQDMGLAFVRAGGLFTYTLEVHIDVDMLNSGVKVMAGQGRDPLFNAPVRHNYDWSAITVQADEALRIAEENGGRALRESRGCDDVHGFLEPAEWEITYRTSYKTMLEFHIDWRTGEIIKKVDNPTPVRQ